MYHLSDSDSHDSDDGIRFKTDSIRYKTHNDLTQRDLYSPYKPFDRRERRTRKSRSRSRSPIRKYEKDKYHKRSYDTKKSSNTYLAPGKSNSHAIKERSPINSSSLIDKCSSDNVTRQESYGLTLSSSSTNKSVSSSEKLKNNMKDDNKNSHSIESQLHQQSEDVPVIEATSAQYGPILPPSTQTFQDTNDAIDHSIEIGPALPTHFEKDKSVVIKAGQHDKKIYGPTLPPFNNIQNQSEAISSETVVNHVEHDRVPFELPPYDDKILSLEKTNDIDSNLPQNMETIDDDCYGPLPPNMISNSKAHLALEERALQMKIDKLGQGASDHITREEWMVELPEVHSKTFGLGPRQFRPNAAPDFSDRSSWTDTPQDKVQKKDNSTKKVDVRKEAELKAQQKYDEEQEEVIKKHKKDKKEKSLVEIHQINLSNKKKEEGPSTRRPFSRDIDLKVNHFDEAQKKAILKKAQLLDDRFSKGQSKYL